MNEFSLIEHFFKPIAVHRPDVLLGIGDDAACLTIPTGYDFFISTDTLVSGIHFLPEWNPYDIAYRAVMVNISDMAAMAAEPCWVTLALTLPHVNLPWLNTFSEGLKEALKKYNVALVGGDTTKGPLSITLTISGIAPKGRGVTRTGAKAGDTIWVSGQLGAAALAVQLLNKKSVNANDKAELMHFLLRPNPRVDLNEIIRVYASASIDISDGLSADLNHICVASSVGACLTENNIPVHPLLNKYLGKQAVDLALCGGDDYELCFTVSCELVDALEKELSQAHLKCYPIGLIEETSGLRVKTLNNNFKALKPKGYSHFS